MIVRVSHDAPLDQIEHALAGELTRIRAAATGPEQQRLAELQRIRLGPSGVIRTEAELTNDDVVLSLNEQLLPVRAQEVDRIIGSFPVDQQVNARIVLARASGFANMESFNVLRAAMEPHLAAGLALYTPGSGSLADNIEYCASKHAFDAISTRSIVGTDAIGPDTMVILDEVVLNRIRTDPGFAADLVANNCVLLDPVGFESGLNMFNAGSSEAIVSRTRSLLDRALQIQLASGGTFDDAVTTALAEPRQQALESANPALHALVQPVDAASPDQSSAAIS